MKHIGRFLLLLTISLLVASCDNAEMLAVRSDDFMPHVMLSNSQWSISNFGSGMVKISYDGTLSGGSPQVKMASAFIRVSTTADMSNVFAAQDAYVQGSRVSGSVVFIPDEHPHCYVQAVCGRSSESNWYTEQEDCIYGPVYEYVYLIPKLSTDITNIGWYSCTVNSGTIDSRGYQILEKGILYSCTNNELEYYGAGVEKYVISGTSSSFKEWLNLGRAAASAKLDQASAPTYYVRTYARNEVGIGYGPIKKINTYRWPALTNLYLTDITTTSATLAYTLTPYSGDPATITEQVAYGTNSSFSTAQIVIGHTMTGLTPGTTYYCRYYFSNQFGESIYKTDAMSFKTLSPADPTDPITIEGTVDLGLPSGLMWAKTNIGASSPEDYGNYFAWGETSSKSNYNWSTYKWNSSGTETYYLTKYITDNASSWVDHKSVLDLEDDAARANLGDSWRMPTDAEWTELRTSCTWIWKTENGVNGYQVKGPNGNSIFLPAAGYWSSASFLDAGSFGYYWSSSLSPENYRAVGISFNSGNTFTFNGDRRLGCSVRPVAD